MVEMKIKYINLRSNENNQLEYCCGISELFFSLTQLAVDFATKNSGMIPPTEILALIETGGVGAIATEDNKVVAALLLRPRSNGVR